MKKMILFFVAVLSFIYTCKRDKSNNNTNITDSRKIEINKGRLQVFLDGIIINDAKIMLLYQIGETIESIYGETIKGKPQMLQRVGFVFPEKIIPLDFCLIFDEPNSIIFEKIVINMNDDKIIIKDSAFYEYFHLSKTMTVENNTLKVSKLDTLRASKSLINRVTNRYSKYKN